MTYKAVQRFLLNTPSDADMGVMRRYKDTDFNKVTSRVHLLHKEHPDLSSDDDVAATIRNMPEATRQYFKGQLRRFFHYILTSLFPDSIASPEAARVIKFAQKRTNKFK